MKVVGSGSELHVRCDQMGLLVTGDYHRLSGSDESEWPTCVAVPTCGATYDGPMSMDASLNTALTDFLGGRFIKQ